jgi:DNA-binding Xre family transcriptional regulator
MINFTMVQSRLKIVWAEFNLKRAREGKRSVSLRDIAKATGLAPSTITGLTTNRQQQVHFRTISLLCAFFGISPGDLFVYTSDDAIDRSEVDRA